MISFHVVGNAATYHSFYVVGNSTAWMLENLRESKQTICSFFSTYIYGDKFFSFMVQLIMGDIHWSLLIGFIGLLSMGSSWFFFLAGYTYLYILPLFHQFTWHAQCPNVPMSQCCSHFPLYSTEKKRLSTLFEDLITFHYSKKIQRYPCVSCLVWCLGVGSGDRKATLQLTHHSFTLLQPLLGCLRHFAWTG